MTRIADSAPMFLELLIQTGFPRGILWSTPDSRDLTRGFGHQECLDIAS